LQGRAWGDFRWPLGELEGFLFIPLSLVLVPLFFLLLLLVVVVVVLLSRSVLTRC
jgi:hypothetical protein